MIRFGLKRLTGPVSLEWRARWVQQASSHILSSLGIHTRVHGTPGVRGLVVANHLSYLDILVLSAAAPCFFVAKVEIGGWPFFGRAARIGGTIFVDRGNLKSAISVAQQMTERMQLPLDLPVLMFPEGTSTDGKQVLRFHSRLIDPATALGMPITTAAIRYVIGDGTPEIELCWYDDMTFVCHLWKVLGVADFWADVRFGSTQIYQDRRQAADATHNEIVALREASAAESVAELR
jgi:1-acyl-sn-glycerol-3-phosphate acyltransferase